MDPNENLKEQLKISESILAGKAHPLDVTRLAELVIALNEWIEKGGLLPEAWSLHAGR